MSLTLYDINVLCSVIHIRASSRHRTQEVYQPVLDIYWVSRKITICQRYVRYVHKKRGLSDRLSGILAHNVASRQAQYKRCTQKVAYEIGSVAYLHTTWPHGRHSTNTQNVAYQIGSVAYLHTTWPRGRHSTNDVHKNVAYQIGSVAYVHTWRPRGRHSTKTMYAKNVAYQLVSVEYLHTIWPHGRHTTIDLHKNLGYHVRSNATWTKRM